VGVHPRDSSPFGVLDLTGNVQEWTETRVPTPADASSRPEWVLRGGSFYWSWTMSQRRAAPDFEDPSMGYLEGFRCAR